MKSLPTGLQDFLDGGEATMVHCWKVKRSDGAIQGFTEHDVDITFDSVTYEASSGFSASQIQSSLGLSVDNLNAEGALASDTINEDDLASGAYDDAEVELYWVNFENVTQRILLSKGNIGRVERGELAFTAELRSLSQRLQQNTGRVYQRSCDAILGDSRCKVSLISYSGTVNASTENRKLTVQGLSNDTKDYYSLGVLTFTSGRNSGLKFEVKSHTTGQITLWQQTPFPIAVGDTFSITAGCDKSITACATKFGNTDNFRGFNLIPGIDRITSHTGKGEGHTGGSIFNV